MADTVRKVDYFYIETPDKPGEGAKALALLRDVGINLLAFSGFPKGRRAHFDFIPEDPVQFKAVARKAGWKLSPTKRGFLIQGEDRVGAVAEHVGKLGGAKINVSATEAVCAGAGCYGVILWVEPGDVNQAAKVLGAASP